MSASDVPRPWSCRRRAVGRGVLVVVAAGGEQDAERAGGAGAADRAQEALARRVVACELVERAAAARGVLGRFGHRVLPRVRTGVGRPYGRGRHPVVYRAQRRSVACDAEGLIYNPAEPPSAYPRQIALFPHPPWARKRTTTSTSRRCATTGSCVSSCTASWTSAPRRSSRRRSAGRPARSASTSTSARWASWTPPGWPCCSSARKHAETDGRELHIEGVNDHVRRLLDLTGTASFILGT